MVLAMSATSGHGSRLSCNNARQVFVNMLPYDVEKRLDKEDEDDTRLREPSSLLARPSIPSLGPGLSRFAAKISNCCYYYLRDFHLANVNFENEISQSVFKQESSFVLDLLSEFSH